MGAMVRAETEEVQVSAENPADKPKFSIVIVLAVLLGVLLSVVIAGGVVFALQRASLKAEVAEVKKQLKGKEQTLADMQKQLEELSMQMLTLKDYAIARSGVAPKGRDAAVDVVPEKAPMPNDKKSLSAPHEAGSKTPAFVVPVKPKAEPKKAKPAKAEPPSTSCELVGKSPKEQEEILRRCVG